LKNKKISAFFKATGGSTTVFDRLYKRIIFSFFSGEYGFNADADRKLKKHLLYNYPSHDFW